MGRLGEGEGKLLSSPWLIQLLPLLLSWPNFLTGPSSPLDETLPPLPTISFMSNLSLFHYFDWEDKDPGNKTSRM